VPPDDRGVEVLQQLDGAGAAARVRGQLEEVDPVGGGQCAREVGQEDGTRLQRRDEQRLATGVRLGQIRSELGDAAADFLARQVDLPDRVAVGGEAAG
jgi:hypothetical protein